MLRDWNILAMLNYVLNLLGACKCRYYIIDVAFANAINIAFSSVEIPMQRESNGYWINRLLFWADLWPHRQNYMQHTFISNIIRPILLWFYGCSSPLWPTMNYEFEKVERIFIRNIFTYLILSVSYFFLVFIK